MQQVHAHLKTRPLNNQGPYNSIKRNICIIRSNFCYFYSLYYLYLFYMEHNLYQLPQLFFVGQTSKDIILSHSTQPLWGNCLKAAQSKHGFGNLKAFHVLSAQKLYQERSLYYSLKVHLLTPF